MVKPDNPYRKSSFALMRMRSKIFDYVDTPKETQSDRVLIYLKARKMRGIKIEQESEPVGPYSGLTRRELRGTGTCEPDWY